MSDAPTGEQNSWSAVRSIIKYFSDFGGFVAFVGLLAGAVTADKGVAVWLTLLAVSALVTAGGVSSLWQNRASASGRQFAISLVSLILSVLVTGVAGYSLITSQSTRPATELRFRSHPELLKGCEIIHGEGTIPDGHKVLIFAQAVNTAGVGIGEYYFQTVATREADGWIVNNLQTGSRGSRIKLFAVLVDERVADSLKGIRAYDKTGVELKADFKTTSLPGAEGTPMVLTRDGSELGCR
jgi:hypothetical protein